MSSQPNQQFHKGDIVVVREEDPYNAGGYMGVVVGARWHPNLRSYWYQYKCQYMTSKMKGQVIPKC